MHYPLSDSDKCSPRKSPCFPRRQRVPSVCLSSDHPVLASTSKVGEECYESKVVRVFHSRCPELEGLECPSWVLFPGPEGSAAAPPTPEKLRVQPGMQSKHGYPLLLPPQHLHSPRQVSHGTVPCKLDAGGGSQGSIKSWDSASKVTPVRPISSHAADRIHRPKKQDSSSYLEMSRLRMPAHRACLRPWVSSELPRGERGCGHTCPRPWEEPAWRIPISLTPLFLDTPQVFI